MISNSSIADRAAFKTGVNDLPVVTQVFDRARRAQKGWATRPLELRLEVLRRARELLAVNVGKMAEHSAGPRSRPVVESISAEVVPLLEACRFLEKRAAKILKTQRLRPTGVLRWLGYAGSEICREPFGVILIIGPGNYPLLLPGVQLLQALSAGNAVVLKPGVRGARAALALRELLLKAGLDPDLLTVLPEDTEGARAAIECLPDKVVFTGSAVVGRKILEQLSPRLIPSTMELSGCDAVLVCADADLDLVTKALRFGLSLNDGATCLGPRRLFVDRSIATEMEGRLARAFRNVPARKSSDVRLRKLVDQALASGAHFIAGGFYTSGEVELPLVLGGVTPECPLLKEDIFAPVLVMVTVEDAAEGIKRVNHCPYRLGASVFTRNESWGRFLAGSLEVGVVTINDLIIPTADARLPFGGRNESGFGVTRGSEGLLEMTRPKVVTRSRGRRRLAFEPAKSRQEELFELYLRAAHGPGLRSRLAALGSLLRKSIKR